MPELKVGPQPGIDPGRTLAGAADEHEIQICLEQARQGDRDAFRTIVRTYERRVFAQAYSMLGNRDDALDVVQETFLRIYERAEMFNTEHNFGAWLSKVARNVCIDYYRKHRRRREEWDSGRTPEELQVASDEIGPDSASRDLKQALAACINALSDRQKEVFVMRHYDELQFNEISRALNISEGTAKSLHFKAVQNLKKRLSPYMGEAL